MYMNALKFKLQTAYYLQRNTTIRKDESMETRKQLKIGTGV